MADASSQPATRPSLLLRLRDPRDAEAWRTFVHTYGPLVYGECRYRGLAHDDAEDVTQKVFGRVVTGIRTFDYQPEVGRFRDWLGTLVRNEINRHLGREARTPDGRAATGAEAVLDGVPDRGEDGAWAAAFNARLLQVALERARPHFEAPTWRAFELVWIEDRPAAEVARELGQPLDWVYVAKSRVLKRLWQEVRELADDVPLPDPHPARAALPRADP
jgi:RNA polymerase sigma-70 factor (ECF subfamily)